MNPLILYEKLRVQTQPFKALMAAFVSPHGHPNGVKSISIYFLNNWTRYCWSGKKAILLLTNGYWSCRGLFSEQAGRQKVNTFFSSKAHFWWKLWKWIIIHALNVARACLLYLLEGFIRGWIEKSSWQQCWGQNPYNFYEPAITATERPSATRTIYKYVSPEATPLRDPNS